MKELCISYNLYLLDMTGKQVIWYSIQASYKMSIHTWSTLYIFFFQYKHSAAYSSFSTGAGLVVKNVNNIIHIAFLFYISLKIDR